MRALNDLNEIINLFLKEVEIMLIARIYALLWLFAAVLGGTLYLTDSFNTMTSIVFGFIVAALGGSALLVVFPVLMHERVASERKVRHS